MIFFERATMGKQGGTSKNRFCGSVIPKAKIREPKMVFFSLGAGMTPCPNLRIAQEFYSKI